MNIGMIACVAIGSIFGIMAVVFALLKEKGAMLISGFNTLPKEERALYDTAKMSADQRDSLIIWTAVFFAGAVASYFLHPFFAIAAFFIWLILFLKEVHLDEAKAFAKYRK